MANKEWQLISEKLRDVLIKHSYELKEDKSTSKKMVILVRAKDKTGTQTEIETDLQKVGFSYSRQKITQLSGSTECTVIDWNLEVKDAKVILVFKPAAGGMQETTLNSTITELAPALAFSYGKKFNNVDTFYEFLKSVDHDTAPVYVVEANRAAGKAFVDQFPLSSKYKEKMENAMGVLDYLYTEHKKKPIKRVYWGYRQKPQGVDSAHKGDVFLQYQDNKMLGVSLKAGGEKTAEPKLNTYVNKVMEQITTQSDITALRKKLFDVVYKQVGCTDANNYDKGLKRDTLQKLSALEKTNLKRYDALYDTGLDIIRETICALLKKDLKKTLAWVKAAIIGEGGEVPLIVVKAFGTNYQILTDDDDIHVFLPKVMKVNAYPSKTSKQDFFMELIGKSETLKLKFSVRTNKVGDEHKLGQFYNLAIKFTGIV